MKIPKSAPTLAALMSGLEAPAESLIAIIAQVREPTVNGRYVHWDKLRHLETPVGLDHSRW